MFEIKFITFALWINTLNVIAENKLSDVELSPLNPVMHVGEELKLTCSATLCPDNVNFLWKTALDDNHGGEPKNEQRISYLLIRNVSVKHENTIICKARCGTQSREKPSVIRVYSFPQDPVVEKIKSLRANQEQKFNCTLHNVYPLEHFTIEWFLGDEKKMVDPDVPSSDHVQNYSSVFNYTLTVDDLGKNITCKATLMRKNMGGNTIFEKTRSSTAEYGPGNMIISNNTSVKLGKRLEITCHADGNPKPRIQWWKLEKTGDLFQSQNQKLIINNASWSQTGWYQCNASNVVGSMQKKVEVIVLGPPSIPKIHVSHRGEPKEGEDVTVLCSSDGRPAELRLYSQSHNVRGGLRESTVRLHIPSIQMADEGIYMCEAKNDFGLKRSEINIRVKSPPRTPKIHVSHIGEPEEGENVTVFCTSDGRPAELTLYRQSHNVTTGLNESTVHLHIPSIQMADEGVYVCEAKNDFGVKTTQINIRVKAQQTNTKMPDLPLAILPAAGSLSLLTIVGLLIRFLRKKNSPVT